MLKGKSLSASSCKPFSHKHSTGESWPASTNFPWNPRGETLHPWGPSLSLGNSQRQICLPDFIISSMETGAVWRVGRRDHGRETAWVFFLDFRKASGKVIPSISQDSFGENSERSFKNCVLWDELQDLPSFHPPTHQTSSLQGSFFILHLTYIPLPYHRHRSLCKKQARTQEWMLPSREE